MQVVVDKARLERILNNKNRMLANSLTPSIISVGHTIPDPQTPEHLQPKTVGAELNYQLVPFGKDDSGQEQWAILVDQYFKRVFWDDEEEGAKTYPFRSAEFRYSTDEINRTALLRREPELAMGAMLYNKEFGEPYCIRENGCVLYGREQADSYYFMSYERGGIADTTVDPAAKPDAMQDAEDKKFTEQFMRCMKSEQFMRCMKPELDKLYAAKPIAPAAVTPPAPAAPAAPAVPPMPAKPPVPPPGDHKPEEIVKKEEDERLQSRMDAIYYERNKVMMDEMQAKVDRITTEALKAKAENIVFGLAQDGISIKNPIREVARYMKAPEAEWAEITTDIRMNYERDPASALPAPGGATHLLQIHNPRAAGAKKGPDEITPQHMEAALKYQRANEIQYAREHDGNFDGLWELALEKTKDVA